MGCAVVPSIACLYMTSLENSFILNPEHNPYFSCMVLYKWYIDDYIIIIDNDAILIHFSSG